MGKVDPKPGDLIEIFRLGYQHWAVCVGPDYVIHLAHPNGVDSIMSIFSPRAVVKKERLSVVAGASPYRVNNKHDSEWAVRSPEEIVSKAEKVVGQKVKYKVFRRNCEHFATMLRYDIPWCDQVWFMGAGVLVGLLILLL